MAATASNTGAAAPSSVWDGAGSTGARPFDRGAAAFTAFCRSGSVGLSPFCFAVSPLADVAGLAVMRTVAMLANEAADAVNQGVCSAAGADDAMRLGVNYPLGPLAWADRIGPPTVREVLARLADHYGEDRYRASPLLQRIVHAGGRFHE